MKEFANRLLALPFLLYLSVGVIDDVEAKRFGSGKLFEALNSNPYKRSYTRRSANQQAAAAHNQQTKQSLNRRGGLTAMLGGVALGGLLGALLFGGAFESLNLFDFAVCGLIGLALYKLVVARKYAAMQSCGKSVKRGPL